MVCKHVVGLDHGLGGSLEGGTNSWTWKLGCVQSVDGEKSGAVKAYRGDTGRGMGILRTGSQHGPQSADTWMSWLSYPVTRHKNVYKSVANEDRGNQPWRKC